MRIVTITTIAVIGVVTCIWSAKAEKCLSSDGCVIRDFSAQLWDTTNIITGPQANFTMRWIADPLSSINPSNTNPVAPSVTSTPFGTNGRYIPKSAFASSFALEFDSINFTPQSPTCWLLQADGRSCSFSGESSSLTEMDVVEIRNTTQDRDQLHLHSGKFGTYETNASAGTLLTLDIQPILFGLEDGIFTVLGGPIQIGFGIPGADLDPLFASTFFAAGMIVPTGPPEFFAVPAPVIGIYPWVLLTITTLMFRGKLPERRKRLRCVPAWKIDPGEGAIRVQLSPPFAP
jgi:hypothetical protein